jgi:integrase
MLSWATEDEQGFIAINPLREARRQKQAPPRRTWLTEQDLQRVLAARYPATHRPRTAFRAFVLLQADTGLRFNEARKLRRDRIEETDDGHGIAHIPDTKNGKPHMVGITPRVFEALDAIPLCLGTPFYFANPENRGRIYSVSTMWRWFRAAADAAGIDNIVADGEVRVRCHDLRRSAATNAHNRGASLLEVQDMLNHSNPGITSQYVQRTPANAVRIAKLMAQGALKEQRRGPQRSQTDVPASLDKKGNREQG